MANVNVPRNKDSMRKKRYTQGLKCSCINTLNNIAGNKFHQCIKLAVTGTTEKPTTKTLSYDMEIVQVKNIYQCNSSHE